MSVDAHSLRGLTTLLASALEPSTMRLADIDRLCRKLELVLASPGTSVDAVALRKLSNNLDVHRRMRRQINTGVLPGQLDFDGNETPDPIKETAA